ncbi:MAG: response regulator transcription factor [Dehalococcoidia bacterium]
MKTLVIEVGQQVAKDVGLFLRLRWPLAVVVGASEGSKGLGLVEAEAPDLVMVDISQPDGDGLELVREIREFSDVPLIVLTDHESKMDGVRALEMGADDYITKPLSAIDFLARVKALLRRTQFADFQRDCVPFLSGDLSINFAARDVFVSGEKVKLTPHEYDLLCHLVRNEGRVLTHRTLLSRVWGEEYVEDCGILKKYVYLLRRKLNDDSPEPRMILTQRGVGYKFARHG